MKNATNGGNAPKTHHEKLYNGDIKMYGKEIKKFSYRVKKSQKELPNSANKSAKITRANRLRWFAL